MSVRTYARPNQLGAEYSLHVPQSFAEHVAPTLGWITSTEGSWRRTRLSIPHFGKYGESAEGVVLAFSSCTLDSTFGRVAARPTNRYFTCTTLDGIFKVSNEGS